MAVFLVHSVNNRVSLEETTNLGDFFFEKFLLSQQENTNLTSFILKLSLIKRASLEETTNLGDFFFEKLSGMSEGIEFY